MKARDPVTPEEWQEAVNWAQALLGLDAARQFGLVTGGPGLRVERCRAILAAGRALGIEPVGAGVDACIAALAGGTS